MKNKFFSFTLKSFLIASIYAESLIKLFYINVPFLYPMKHKKIGCFLISSGGERKKYLVENGLSNK